MSDSQLNKQSSVKSFQERTWKINWMRYMNKDNSLLFVRINTKTYLLKLDFGQMPFKKITRFRSWNNIYAFIPMRLWKQYFVLSVRKLKMGNSNSYFTIFKWIQDQLIEHRLFVMRDTTLQSTHFSFMFKDNKYLKQRKIVDNPVLTLLFFPHSFQI